MHDLLPGLFITTRSQSSNSMEGYKQAASVLKGLVDGSIAFDATTLDAAKSSIVYGITKGVSTAGRAVRTLAISD
jgi:hypothetical protein